ncbi:MAG: Ig-like domain-containing protein, partial [Anaerolineae bacterium]|nr:Ig-like domain-containing protein [Anaerolineae bacterium]
MLTRLVRTGLAVAIICAVVLSACVPTSSSPTSAPAPTSAPPSDAIPTAIIQRTPERGEEMATDGTIELVFDRAMERRSVEAAFRLRPAVGGSFEWPDERTVRFVPKQELKRDTSFKVTLDASAMSVDGSSLAADYGFRFETVGYLEVAQVVPAPDTADVEAASTITAVFNRPVVPLQAISDPDSANLPQPVAFTPPIEGSGEWLNTSIYVFTPSADLAGGTNYTAQVTAGLADTTGGVLDKDFVWSFSTQPPQVVWILPHDQQELVDINTSIQVTFNMPVDPDSAASAFHLPGNRTEVAGEISVVESTLTFTPTDPLAFNTRYTAWVDSGVPSAAGGRGMREDYPWEFTTVPLPRIIGTNPADGDRSASPYTAFEIKFNTPINANTVMPSLTMEPPLSPTQVYTYFNTWDNIFIIEFGSQPSTDYTVHISPNIADPYGNTTGQDITVRYRTAPLAPRAYLNVPGMIGTMDAHQPSQMLVSYLNTTRLDLRLHPLDQAEFLKAQRDWWDFDPTAPPMRDWSIPVEAIQNEMLYKQINLADVSSSLEPGIYMLELRAPEVDFDRWSQRRLLVVSEYNVTIKNSRDEVWVWVTNLQTGEPTAGLTLTLWDYEGASAGERTTDTDGLARFALTSGTRHDSYTVVSQQPFVLGSSGWDWSTGISPWDFGLEQEHQYGDFRFHIYTDRPIYRPDQIVRFRGVVRAEDDARYNLPDGASVSVEVYDAVGEQIFASDLDLDDFGAFHGDFDVVAGASLGQYSIQATFADESAYASFRVAAYRPPEFQMTVSPDASELAAGDVTKATLDLAYFFGGPVADVTIDWNVLSTPYRFEPAQFQRYAFTDSDDLWLCRWCRWPQPDQVGTIVANGSGTTDSDGGLSIALPTQIMTGRHRLTIEGTAYGRDGQAISGRADVVVHPASFYVGLAPQQYVTDAGDETAVDIVTVGWGGQRVPDIPLEIQVFHREWANIFVENELGGGSWKWETTDTLVFTGTLNTDSNAEGIATFTPEQGGSYRVIVSGRDRKERL